MTIREINEKYIELYNDLYLARAVLPDVQYNVMHKALHKQYVEDIRVCIEQIKLETGRSTFELRYKLKNYLPRRSFLIYNKVAKALLKNYKKAFKIELKELEINTIDTSMRMKDIDNLLNDMKKELKALPGIEQKEDLKEETSAVVPVEQGDLTGR